MFFSKPIKQTRQKTLWVYEDTDKDWRWQLINSNGRITADNGEGYNRKADAIRAAKKLKEIASQAVIKW